MTKPIVGGRPLLFEKPEELIEKINQYFSSVKQEELTITGLCLAIGTSKQVLSDYGDRSGYGEIVAEAKLIVENSYELSLRKHGRTGDIFALKNFGWKDKTEVDVNAKIKHDETIDDLI